MRKYCVCAMMIVGVLPAISVAQDANDTSLEYSVLEAVDRPVGDSSEDFRAVAKRADVRSDTIYASKLDGDLTGARAQSDPATTVSPRQRSPMDLNGFGVVLAVGLVIGALFLWLKFGGGGTLLAREPRDDARRKHATPDAWKMGDEAIKDADGLLAQIAQMTDRTAAMVLLLRHCLLAAARATDARFARSDTERGAFGRLPANWIHRTRLETMLQHTELAHYGGRDVAQDRFDDALDAARRILNGAKYAGGARG